MATVNSDIDVSAPISSVYNQWTQFESFPQFLGGVDEVVQKSDTQTHWKVSIAGVTREFDAEITEQIPDERVAWNSTSGEEHAGVVTFHRLSDSETRISLRMDWTPQGVVESAGALLQVDDMQIKKDLKKFKELIESNGFETGAWRGSVDRSPDATGR
ncbi:SRPBCC family protein [Mycetocola manganoxydans]|uniref:SRPBCC family protein n=1 Tax=Mycetocola manganoxydans TaxID=699879 RepID=A0A3L6ZVU9_9MICO|nr:SRPBCC family protein [Mycetocola manganoxydans]RLP72027.1 SRPBCC family protein [Mycetocola manganoxydans]GHD47605.1 cyclase [Mycetocola manganoxydans]